MNQEYNKWFGNRLREILDEKVITQKELSSKTGMSVSTISRILNGRFAAYDEVQKIADALEISIVRLKQTDVDLSSQRTSPYKIVESENEELHESERNVSVALGITERGFALQTLGASYVVLKRYEDALGAFETSYKLLQHSKDNSISFQAFRSLIYVLLLSKDLDTVEKRFEEFANEQSPNDDKLLVEVLMHKAAIYTIHLKKYDVAIAIYQRLLGICKKYKSLDWKSIENKVLCNIADTHLWNGDNKEAVSYYERWYNNSPEKTVEKRLYYVTYCKDYAKALFYAGESKSALLILDSILEEVRSLDAQKLLEQCYLLYSMITKDGKWVEKVIEMQSDEYMKMLSALIIYFGSKDQDHSSYIRTILTGSF